MKNSDAQTTVKTFIMFYTHLFILVIYSYKITLTLKK